MSFRLHYLIHETNMAAEQPGVLQVVLTPHTSLLPPFELETEI